MRSFWIKVGPNTMTGVIMRRGKFGTHTGRVNLVIMEAEIEVMQL